MESDTLLFRVVKSREWFSDGRLSDQVFRPRAHEHNKISVYDSEMVTAETAYRNYAKDPSLSQPPGVVAVTYGECTELGIDVQPPADNGHVTLTFPGTTDDSLTETARALSAKALERGWQYRAPQPRTSQPHR